MVRSRIRILIALLVLPFLTVLGRLAALQLFQDPEDEDLQRADSRTLRIGLLAPTRGSILDRNGGVLAQDVTTFDIQFSLKDLHPRERYLPVLERALGLCDDRCRLEERPAEGGEAGSNCLGAVLEDHLQRVLAGRDLTVDPPAGEEKDPVLVDGIPPSTRNRIRQRLIAWKMGGLEALDLLTGLYFIPGDDGRSFELRVKPREALAMEITLRRISLLIGEPCEALRERVAKVEQKVARARTDYERSVFRNESHLLARNIQKPGVTEMSYRPELYRGITIANGRRRVYPLGEAAAAITGYLRPPGERESKEGLLLDDYLLSTDFLAEKFEVLRRIGCRKDDGQVGSHGLEEYYDARLRGAFGAQIEEVDVHRVTRRNTTPIPPERGEDLRTSLEAPLQKLLYESLVKQTLPEGEAQSGCVAVMDLTGRRSAEGTGPPGAILASVGCPDYQPDRLRDQDYLREIDERETLYHQGILFNYDRPARFHQPPGSVFKTVVAVAAMLNGVAWPTESGPPVNRRLAPQETYRCEHWLDPANPRSLTCLGSGHNQPEGRVDLVQALQFSCNIYFYHLGRDRLQPRALWAWAREFGFGRSTGIDLDNPDADLEGPAGVLRDEATRENMCQYAIGSHTYVQASALQVLRATAGIALGGGQLPWPYLATPRPPQKLAAGPEVIRVIQEGMRRVVHAHGGTASGDELGLSRYRVALKTGTAELKKGDPKAIDPRDRPVNCAWMAGYAPFDQPEMAFVVVLDRVPYHGSECAPVAVKVLEHFAEREPEKYLVKDRVASGGERGRRAGTVPLNPAPSTSAPSTPEAPAEVPVPRPLFDEEAR
jgi:cell division protein FtsI/penicillin-binding protein 2